ncbi:DUF2487 family protein [Aciduricibacillus chroicocephali]|uniref:DUF2487 family protein n=1 Tax=Aciduricibacillus chroicocephali TaxID=3054939 RepID=A0ABY9KT51_9BACI|nr:DUF2487 family protein [Bacillaceae bacterium 44XB]
MKWVRQDAKRYLEAKEFIDTAVIPLIPLDISHEDGISKTALYQETTQIFTSELEKELAGRVMLFPAYVYLPNEETDSVRLQRWVDSAQENGFKHVFLTTFDSSWRKHAKNMSGELVWLPCPTEMDMETEEFGQSAKGLAREVIRLMREVWN